MRVGRSIPHTWSCGNLYDLVKQKYPEWRLEIIQQKAVLNSHVDMPSYSSVMTGSVYMQEQPDIQQSSARSMFGVKVRNDMPAI